MQMKIPKFQLAHLGSGKQHYQSESIGGRARQRRSLRLFLLQSAHVLFPSSFKRLLIVCVFCAARSAAGLGGLRDIVVLGCVISLTRRSGNATALLGIVVLDY
jgi:hypothetical protein